MTLTTFQNLLGIVLIVLGLASIAVSTLLKRGKLKPGSTWGRSAAEAFWQGIGLVAWGLGHLAHFVTSENSAVTLKIMGALVFIVAMLVARRKVAAV